MKKLTAFLLLACLLLTGCTFEYAAPEDASTAAVPTVSTGETMLVHFIDVGQADCALLECGGEYMLIDGGNQEDGQLVVSYLEQQGVEELHTIISTHPHEDHVGGLPAVLAVYPTEHILATTRTYSSGIYDDFLYYADQQGIPVEIPTPGDTFSLGGAEITILGPVESYADTNDTSIVCRVNFGSTSFLFTGDMESQAEMDMMEYWDGQVDWDVDVLKVGHHGSYSSTCYRFLYKVSPEYGIISCGRDNSYGHPHDEPMSRLKDAGTAIFRTDEMGSIMAISDGSQIIFTWENQNAEPENAERAESSVEYYVGNKNSKKLHTPDCDNLPSEKNQVQFDSYEAAIAEGYTPCGSCLG